MLIVNADDFGASARTTDAAVSAFAVGAISSATAMVWMSDSARSAAIARERRLPLGLHLNLTLAFSDSGAPQAVRDRHESVLALFDKNGWRDGRLLARAPTQLLVDAIADQLGRFRDQFGEPTHIDGHHHVHVHDAVLDCLPTDLPIRPVLRVPSRADAAPSRRERQLRRRFRTAEVVVAFEHLHPDCGGDGLELLERARWSVLEVMTHPAQDQLPALLGDTWRSALSGLELGSYAQLLQQPDVLG